MPSQAATSRQLGAAAEGVETRYRAAACCACVCRAEAHWVHFQVAMHRPGGAKRRPPHPAISRRQSSRWWTANLPRRTQPPTATTPACPSLLRPRQTSRRRAARRIRLPHPPLRLPRLHRRGYLKAQPAGWAQTHPATPPAPVPPPKPMRPKPPWPNGAAGTSAVAAPRAAGLRPKPRAGRSFPNRPNRGNANAARRHT